VERDLCLDSKVKSKIKWNSWKFWRKTHQSVHQRASFIRWILQKCNVFL